MSSGAVGPATPEEISNYEPVIGFRSSRTTQHENENVLQQPDQLWRASEHQRLSGLPGTSWCTADAQPASSRASDPGGAGDALSHQSFFAICAETLLLSEPAQRPTNIAVR